MALSAAVFPATGLLRKVSLDFQSAIKSAVGFSNRSVREMDERDGLAFSRSALLIRRSTPIHSLAQSILFQAQRNILRNRLRESVPDLSNVRHPTGYATNTGIPTIGLATLWGIADFLS